ncbi:hypothetical protein ASC97_30420 [Rhizobium sp. Root1203]|nr:hypothetical protein ASC97_30420 [Rhizobium sp. Root1203]
MSTWRHERTVRVPGRWSQDSYPGATMKYYVPQHDEPRLCVIAVSIDKNVISKIKTLEDNAVPGANSLCQSAFGL